MPADPIDLPGVFVSQPHTVYLAGYAVSVKIPFESLHRTMHQLWVLHRNLKPLTQKLNSLVDAS